MTPRQLYRLRKAIGWLGVGMSASFVAIGALVAYRIGLEDLHWLYWLEPVIWIVGGIYIYVKQVPSFFDPKAVGLKE